MTTKPTPEQVEAALARWRTKLKRAFGAVEKLERQQKRIGKKPPPVTMIAIAAPEQPAPELKAIEDAIPDFLKRAKSDTARKSDLEARVEIEVEQANRRLAKSRARIAKMKAKKAGDLKKMPLSGRAALDHIRNG